MKIFKNCKSILLLFFIGFLFNSGFALNVISYLKDTTGVTFTLNQGKMKINVCSNDIVRISYTISSDFAKKLLPVVNKKWTKTDFIVSEQKDTIIIKTSRIQIKVNKINALISFLDILGNMITSEYDKSLNSVNIEGINTYRVSSTFNSPQNEGLYGFGQHQKGVVNYKGLNETIWQNYDDSFAESSTFLVSSRGYGIFWDNYSLSWFYGGEGNNTRYSFISECGDMLDYYFFYGPEIDKIISNFRIATGESPLLPKWAFGLIQSKDHYSTQSEILSIKDGYRKNKIPIDCIVQDWQYWSPNPWGSHIMDPSRYPNPKAMVDTLHKENIHTMISVWSIIQEGSSNFSQLNSIGALWPVVSGTHHYLDVYNSNGRAMFWNQMCSQLLCKYGFDAWWFDGDEPTAWPDKYDLHSIQTALGKGCLVYNTYSFTMIDDAYNFWRRDIPNKRCVILSRSSFAGQQRAGVIVWNNDIQSNWDALAKSIPAGLNFCLSGQPYWCTDIGGYWGNNIDWTTPANRELFTRWFQYGVFQPICRIHGNGGSRELYSNTWDNQTKINLLKMVKLRYRLIPYIYSLAWMVKDKNYTTMRHLIMDFTNDEKVKNIGNQYMFGPAFMVSPITTQGATSRTLYLPSGKWYDFWTGDSLIGARNIISESPIDRIPLHIKGGSIVPLGPDIQYATERSDTIELRIYPGSNGNFNIYEDAGDGYEYEKGEYSLIPVNYIDNPRNVIIEQRIGSYPNMDKKKVFNIVYVKSGHGVGEGITRDCDCQLIYTGEQVSCMPIVGIKSLNNIMRQNNFYPKTIKSLGQKLIIENNNKTEKMVYFYNLKGEKVGALNFCDKAIDINKELNLPMGIYIVKILLKKVN